MSERGRALYQVIADTACLHTPESYAEAFPEATDKDRARVRFTPENVARAICEHLGITHYMAKLARGEEGLSHVHGAPVVSGASDVLATLLEAAGIEPGERSP